MRAIIPIFLLCICCVTSSLQGQSENNELEQVFASAERSFNEGSYKKALLDYTRLINSGYEEKSVWVKSGLAHYHLKEYAEALSDFDEAYRKMVRTPELLGYRALTKYHLKNTQEALIEFEQAFAAGFKNYEAAFLAGNLFFEAANYASAITHYEMAVALDQSDPVVYNNLGKAQTIAGKPSEALKNFDKALELNNTYTRALRNRAEVYFELKNWKEARSDYELLQDGSMEADDFARLGLACSAMKDFPSAIQNLENALKRQSEIPELYRALGLSYAANSDTDKAIKTLEVSLSKDGESPEVMESLAQLYFEKKQYATCIKYVEDAQKAGSSSTTLDAYKGISFYYQENTEMAYSLLTQINGKTDINEVYVVLGHLFFEKELYNEVITSLAKVEGKRENAELLVLEAKAYTGLEQYQKAQDNLTLAKSLDPANSTIRILSARNSMILNHYDIAEKDLSYVLTENPELLEANYLYGEVLLMKKEYSTAIKFLTKALSVEPNPHVSGMLGMAYFKLSDFSKAYPSLKTAAETKNLSAQGLHDLAISAMETGSYQEALTYTAEAVQAGIAETTLLKTRGLSNYHTSDFESAKNDLTQAATNSKDSRIPAALGHIAFEEKNYEKAAEWLSSAVALGDKEESTLLLRGRAYLTLMKYTQALEDFSQLLQTDKDHDDARYYRGVTYFESSSFEQAAEDLLLVNAKSLNLPVNEMIAISYFQISHVRALEYGEKAIQLGTQMPDIFFQTGILQAKEKEFTVAVTRLDQAEKMGVTHALLKETRGEAHYNLQAYDRALVDLSVSGSNKKLIGMCHYFRKNYEPAIASLSTLTEHDASSLIALGDSYYRMEKWNAAEKIFDEIVAGGQADAQVYRHRGMVYAASSRPEKAKEDLIQALSMEPEDALTVDELGLVYSQLKEYNALITLFESNRGLQGLSGNLTALAGKAHYHLGKFDQASTLLNEVARNGLADAASLALLGHILYMAEEYEKALENLEKAINAGSVEAKWLQWKGLALYKLEKYTQASIELDEAIKQGIIDKEVFYAAGVSAYETNKSPEAIVHLTGAIDQGFPGGEVYFYRGNAHFKQGSFELAVKDYEVSFKNGWEDPVLWNNRGKALANLGRMEEAIASYSNAIALDGEYVKALENRGETYFQMAKYPEATEDFRIVISLTEDKDGSIRYMLGEAYYLMKDYRKAVVYYGEAIEKGKASADVYFKRGSSFAEVNDLSNALKDLNQAFGSGKNDAELFLARANVHIGLENARAAMSDLNEAIAKETSNSDAYFNRGYLHELNENYTEAISDYSKAIEINPEDGIAYYSLANSLVSQGNVGGALNPIDKAIALEPENGNYYKVKGNILYRVSKNDEACKNWRQAVELGDAKADFYISQYCD